MYKIAVLTLVFLCVLVQSACTKPKSKADSRQEHTILSNPESELLETLLSSPSLVFTDAGGESELLARNILDNKTEFLHDLAVVLNNDTHDLLVLADKKHFLSEYFIPHDIISLAPNQYYTLNRKDLSLRKPVEEALREMAEAASSDGVNLVVSSTYRSYEYQKALYERNVKQLGQEAADRESAKPGSSQHQLGTAIDFGSITDDFAFTKEGRWLETNAGKWGFSLSYPQGYETVTGYRWECWHYRYIGKQAVEFQKLWFNNVQQYMLEFIHNWKASAVK